MIGRIEVFLRRIRRRFSRSEWLARLLRLPVSTGTETKPGLVMVQIDGLAQAELERAIARGEMPFLRQLIRREHYRLQELYAGVPAATATFQGELFYGVPGGVPGFNFMERASGHLVRMFEPAAAARVEHILATKGGKPLLEQGSCYADNFTGGAAEPHFCPSSEGWGPSLREANLLATLFFIVINTFSFLRTAVLLVLEFALALVDLVRGLIKGEDIFKELKFIPTRVLIVILLRELATVGTKIDVARGLPIIHVNFLGYDEQAHRRGPSSQFAHWTLKGIDDAIARIWRGTHHSARRHYDVWIYSDHGQEHTRSYEKLHGRSFSEAVAGVFARHEGKSIQYQTSGPLGVQLQRARLFGGKWTQRLFSVKDYLHEASEAPLLAVAPMGPVAKIYYHRNLAAEEYGVLAQAMVKDADVPLVLSKESGGCVRAWTEAGTFTLPEDRAEILGADHPFLNEATQDLIALCHHPDGGDFIAWGWRAGMQAISFSIENGAHGAAGPTETNAFALLPGDISLPGAGRDYARPNDLRQAALRFLGRPAAKAAKAPVRQATEQQTLRVMTYNVHSCIGMDGKLSPERVARIIARYAPDVVALQELDVGRARTESTDQAHLIARYLEMNFHFHPAMHIEEERYGDAILTHFPMELVKAAPLPSLSGKPELEPRGALWVAIDVVGTKIQVMNTHLGLQQNERIAQAEALLGADWLAHPDCRKPVILCGDFNARPSSPVCRRLRRRLNDAQIELDGHWPKRTFSGRFPAARIDHVFVDSSFEVKDIEVPNTELNRLASDHLPLIVEVQVR